MRTPSPARPRKVIPARRECALDVTKRIEPIRCARRYAITACASAKVLAVAAGITVIAAAGTPSCSAMRWFCS